MIISCENWLFARRGVHAVLSKVVEIRQQHVSAAEGHHQMVRRRNWLADDLFALAESHRQWLDHFESVAVPFVHADYDEPLSQFIVGQVNQKQVILKMKFSSVEMYNSWIILQQTSWNENVDRLVP